jgi:hypothetical protein
VTAARIAAIVSIVILAGGPCAIGCRRGDQRGRCDVNGPAALVPASVKQVRLGMSTREVEGLLGKATYSPIDGQYYYSTGGECPLEATGRNAPCGVIADFRRGPDYRVTDTLQSCTWGAIGE